MHSKYHTKYIVDKVQYKIKEFLTEMEAGVNETTR